ncbi:MAG: hypothetical protein ACYTG0_02470 [Planctomycetota bacterium]
MLAPQLGQERNTVEVQPLGNRKPYVLCYYEKGKYDPDGGGDAPAEDAAPVDTEKKVGEKLIARRARKGQPTLWVHDGRWRLLGSGNFYDLENDPDEKSPIMKGEAGPVGERKRAIFEQVLHEKSKIQKEYGPAALADIPSR